MQQRHHNRRQYFCELANTAREFYLDYLCPYVSLTPEMRVLEIGCGEGGNLLPFAEAGCTVTGCTPAIHQKLLHYICVLSAKQG